MYIYIYMCIYIYTHTHIHTHTHDFRDWKPRPPSLGLRFRGINPKP